MEQCINNELNLAQKLRESCFPNGSEKDPKNSVTILCELGKIYKEKHQEKISLIRSCALFNAALVRCESNKSFVQNKLAELCKIVLKQAKATKQDADLIKAANMIKLDISTMRETAAVKLSKLENIPQTIDRQAQKEKEVSKIRQTKRIEDDITDQFISVMKKVCDFCCDVMGNPPHLCEFALAGMGSTAKKEVTPYSDFESVILLDDKVKMSSADHYKDVIEHFRWLSVLFQIVLINVGETVLPSVAVPCLNDHSNEGEGWFFDAFTICGISCDGMKPHACKIPLGRHYPTSKKNFETELIKTVSDMLLYLDREEDLKNGYHLADVLTQTCFVTGNLTLYETFRNSVIEKLKADKHYSNTKAIKAQIKEDYLQFNVSDSIRLMYLKQFSIKSVVYRSMTLFLSALGRLYCLKDPSSFEIIKSLSLLGIIDDDTKHKLEYAVATACEVRLKFYTKRREQNDRSRHRLIQNKEGMSIVTAVGGRSIVDFFVIAQQLQTAVMALNDDDPEQKLRLSDVTDFNLIAEVCYVLNLGELLIENCKNSLLQMSKLQLYTEEDLALHSTCLEIFDVNKTESQFLNRIKSEAKVWKKVELPISQHKAYMLYKLGFVLENKGNYEKSLIHFRKQLEMQKALSVDRRQDFKVAGSYFHIGYCLMRSGSNTESAKENFLEALKIRTNITTNRLKDFDIANIYLHLGKCQFQAKNYKESLSFFNKSLKILKNISLDEKNDSIVFEVEKYIEDCNDATTNLK